MVEFKTQVPGTYILVDHSLGRLQKGAAGFLDVEGPPNPKVFQSIQQGSHDGGGHSSKTMLAPRSRRWSESVRGAVRH